MKSVAGVPNWLSLLVAVGALAYITRNSWRGKVGI